MRASLLLFAIAACVWCAAAKENENKEDWALLSDPWSSSLKKRIEEADEDGADLAKANPDNSVNEEEEESTNSLLPAADDDDDDDNQLVRSSSKYFRLLDRGWRRRSRRRRYRRRRYRRRRSRRRRSRRRRSRRRQKPEHKEPEHKEPEHTEPEHTEPEHQEEEKTCQCEGGSCKCCKEAANAEVCVELAKGEGEDITVTITSAGESVATKQVPLTDTEPLCGTVGEEEYCAELHDTSDTDGVLHACVKLTKPEEEELGCGDFGSSFTEADDDFDSDMWFEVI